MIRAKTIGVSMEDNYDYNKFSSDSSDNITESDIEFYESYGQFEGEGMADSPDGYSWHKMNDHCRYDFTGGETGIRQTKDRPFPMAINTKKVINPDIWSFHS